MDEFMQRAIDEARKGLAEGGIPIGSVLVRNGVIIGCGHNRRVQDNDPIMHAEMACIQNAGRQKQGYRDCTLYSTLMPCHLCAGAVIQFGIGRVVVGESRTFPGARSSMESKGVVVVDLDLPQCVELMQRFIECDPALWDEDIGK